MRLGGTGALAVMDQAVISASNFVTMVVMARVLSADAFGLFTLGYAVLFLLNALQDSVITEPHAVLSARRTGSDFVDYTTSTAWSQLAFVLAIALAAGLLVIVTAVTDADDVGPFACLGIAAVGWQLQEFVRRVLFVQSRLRAVVVNDVLSFGGQAIAVIGLSVGHALTVDSGLLAIGVTSLVAAALGGLQVRPVLRGRAAWADVRSNLAFGRWLAAAQVSFNVAIRSYLYLVAALVGTGGTGFLGAATVLFGPINVLLFSAGTLLPIRLARTRAVRGDADLRGQLARFQLLTTPLIVAYCLAIAIAANPLMTFLYGDKYPDATAVIFILAVYNILRYPAGILTAGMKARQQARGIFVANTAAAVFAVLGGSILVAAFGVAGAATGMAIGTGGLALICWLYLRAPEGAAAFA